MIGACSSAPSASSYTLLFIARVAIPDRCLFPSSAALLIPPPATTANSRPHAAVFLNSIRDPLPQPTHAQPSLVRSSLLPSSAATSARRPYRLCHAAILLLNRSRSRTLLCSSRCPQTSAFCSPATAVSAAPFFLPCHCRCPVASSSPAAVHPYLPPQPLLLPSRHCFLLQQLAAHSHRSSDPSRCFPSHLPPAAPLPPLLPQSRASAAYVVSPTMTLSLAAATMISDAASRCCHQRCFLLRRQRSLPLPLPSPAPSLETLLLPSISVADASTIFHQRCQPSSPLSDHSKGRRRQHPRLRRCFPCSPLQSSSVAATYGSSSRDAAASSLSNPGRSCTCNTLTPCQNKNRAATSLPRDFFFLPQNSAPSISSAAILHLRSNISNLSSPPVPQPQPGIEDYRSELLLNGHQ
ncbi:hypothetical protein BHE74_00031090 [Ensete ventricosum]|nr:hypothetical protein BHE74_00031090 [Ensete ventricosum]